eukprot:m.74199 g.74199  ORF g.74199 m.74199 type:complete len:124 (+) comp12452_c0_seq5:638-1009(+)
MLHFRITFLLYVFANHNFAELMVCWRTSAYIEYKVCVQPSCFYLHPLMTQNFALGLSCSAAMLSLCFFLHFDLRAFVIVPKFFFSEYKFVFSKILMQAIDFDNEATTLIVGKDHGSDNILKTT